MMWAVILYKASIIDKITLFPTFLIFVLSAGLGFLTLRVTDLSTKSTLLNYAAISFIAGTLIIAVWIVSWIINRGVNT